jgi:hypothetical protein
MECQAKGNSMSDINEGRIVRFIPGNPSKAVIEVALPDIEHVTKRQYERVLVEFVDNRRLTDDQRKKAWAILGEIADWQGDLPESIHRLMKLKFKVEMLKSLANEIFSLSNCDMTTAREYISYLIDFMITWGVPSKVPLYELCEDIQRYVYTCAVNKRCAVCGVKADLHHHERVGMGRDRREINHIGMQCVPLCQAHHMEVDQIGDPAFYAKYHIETVPIDAKIAKVYKLNTKEKTA